MKTLICSDIHGKHANIPFVQKFIAYARDWKPDYIILDGDILDCGELTHFPIVPGSEDFKEEIELMRLFFQALRRNAPDAKIIYILANHEDHLRQQIIKQLPQLYGLVEVTLESLLGLDELDIEVVTQNQDCGSWIGSYVWNQGYAIGHFKRVSKHAGYTAKLLMDDYWCSVVQAHVHRGAIIQKRSLDGKIYYGVESGCMCELKAEYMLHSNWQNCFVTIENGIPDLIQ